MGGPTARKNGRREGKRPVVPRQMIPRRECACEACQEGVRAPCGCWLRQGQGCKHGYAHLVIW
jgi:hypothetical protein